MEVKGFLSRAESVLKSVLLTTVIGGGVIAILQSVFGLDFGLLVASWVLGKALMMFTNKEVQVKNAPE